MSTEIHRLLDEAFAGVELDAQTQDLKEEIRANLLARVDELEASGATPAEAARRAIDELGDVRELVGGPDAAGATAGEAAAQGSEPVPGGRRPEPRFDATAFAQHRVRPRPAFVLRTVLFGVVAAVALALFGLGVTSLVSIGVAGLLGLAALVAVPLGMLTADALLQETTHNHPLPRQRAAGFGAATGVALAALALGAVFAAHPDDTALLVAAALLAVVAVAVFAWLGATQTNRHKAWTRSAAEQLSPNRFEEDPEAAARFGIYTVVIWLVALGVIVALGLTVGWWWGLLAVVGGLAATMLVLARMLFRPRPPGG